MHATMLKKISMFARMAEHGLLALSALTMGVTCLLISPTPGASCIPSERNALVAFRASLLDPAGRLSSWNSGHSCCRWRGVQCDASTGHVVKLDLRNSLRSYSDYDWILFYEFRDDIDFTSWEDNMLALRSTGENEISSSLASLHHLRYLDLSGNYFNGSSIPLFISDLKNLRYLNLSGPSFSGRIPPQLGNLSNLQYLDVSLVSMSSSDLSWLPRLSSLRYLDMTGVDLSAVRDWVHSVNMLSSVKVLRLSDCKLESAISTLSHFNLTLLEVLDLSYNKFNSSLQQKWLWDHTSLKELYLTDGHWFGSIPDTLGNMSALQVMHLGHNKLMGTIPTTLEHLCDLQIVSLYDNNIDGDAKEFMERLPRCSWSKLLKLDLHSTNLSGELPVWIGNLSSLNFVDLSQNTLIGKLPVGFGALRSMIYLNLGLNNFSGLIFEEHFASLLNLKYLYLSGNSFKMVFGEDWIPPFRLKIAHLRSCHLGPRFPSWLRWQTEIMLLDVSGTCISDYLPVWFWTLFSHAYTLNLSDNQLNGTLPKTLEYMSATVMNLGSNNLTGQVPRFPVNITYFDLSNNSLSGPLPSDLRAPRLEELRLYSNYITGTIPASLCQLRRLVSLYLSSNHLTGEFPRCSDNYTVLLPPDTPDPFFSPYFGYGMSTIDLSNNSFTGQFPLFLENATVLRFLDLSHNNFCGKLPSWIAKKIPYLRFLRLQSNMFSGHIPEELTNCFGLHYLDLANNNISGIIPRSLAGMKAMRRTTLDGNRGDVYTGSISSFTKGQELHYTFSNYNLVVYLDLSGNSLTGQIPEEISLLLGLKSLNLSGNQLGGKIPNTIGDLKELESLDLSHNGLSGEIPSTLSELTSLSWLNLSYNNLSGKIPSGHQLQALNDQEYIYVGNPGLCGPPLSNNCSMRGRHDELEDSMSNGMPVLYIGMSTGFVISLWLVFCALLFRKDWRIAYFMLFDRLCDKIYVQVAFKLRSRSSVTGPKNNP